MSELLRVFIGLFAAVAPFGTLPVIIAYRRTLEEERSAFPDARILLFAPGAALVALAAAAAVSGPLLDWLDVSGESFQFAAGAAMIPLAVRLIFTGDSMPLPERLPSFAWLVPFALPLLAGPGSLIAAVSYAGRFGEAEVIAAGAAVLAITAAVFAAAPVAERWPPIVVSTLGRFSGGLLIVIATELAVDGVQSV